MIFFCLVACTYTTANAKIRSPHFTCSRQHWPLELLDLCSGTIQGSGIGPLLFIAYINELADVLSADDLKLYAVLATD